jgi:hypothetical protein
LKVEHVDGAGGYLHVVDGKGGKQRIPILPKPILEALKGHLNDREVRAEIRGHISTGQIQRLLDTAAVSAGL